VIASALGLAAFSIAIIAGLAADNPTDVILLRALASMFVCYLIGSVIGLSAERALQEAIDRYAQDNPAPAIADSSPSDAGDQEVIEV